MNHRSPQSTRRRLQRGLSLLETIVVCLLMSMIGVALVSFYQVANIEYTHSMSAVTLGSHARTVSEKVLPYVSTAVPMGTDNSSSPTFIYSPDVGGTNGDPTTMPNIYCLDFSTGVDLLRPSNNGLFQSLGQINNTRGTGTFYRYRLRFEPTNVPQKGQLLLERMNPAAAVSGSTPAALTTGNYAPKLLGKNLYAVNFLRTGNQSVTMKIVARALLVDWQGRERWVDSQIVKTTQGRTRSADPNSNQQGTRGLEYTLFSTVIIPYWTSK